MTLWDVVTDEIIGTVHKTMPEADCMGARQYLEMFGYITGTLVCADEYFEANGMYGADDDDWDRYNDDVWVPYLESLGYAV